MSKAWLRSVEYVVNDNRTSGNRTVQTVGGTSTSFTLNSDDELTATSGGFTNSYTYNSNGEQTNRTLSGTSYTLAYDYDGELTSSTVGGVATSFTYDALGRRPIQNQQQKRQRLRHRNPCRLPTAAAY